MPDSEKLKIIHFTKHFFPVWGGLERFVHGLITHTSDKFNHEIWCYNDDLAGHKNKLDSAFFYDGIPVHRVKCLKKGWLHSGNFPLESVQSADIIHVHNMDILLDQVLFLLLKHKLKIPVVVSTHGLIFHHENGIFFKTHYLKLANRLRKNQIALVLASGNQDLEWLKNQSSFLPVTLFPNPLNVSQDVLFPDKTNSSGVLFISRAQQSKRIDVVFHLYTELRNQGYSDELTLILSGSETEINTIVKQHTDEIKTGNIEVRINVSETEKWDLLKVRKLYLNPSLYEGFGYSIFEALISNCLTLVTGEVFCNFVCYGFPNLFAAKDFYNLPKTAKMLIQLNEQKVSLPESNFQPAVSLIWKDRKHELERLYTSLITE